VSGLRRAFLVGAVLAALARAATAEVAAANPDPIEARLRARVQSEPEHASSWRLLGHLLLERGELEEARAALERAVALDPLSAAAEFDLARTLAASGETGSAAEHFRHVQAVAPDSEYARLAGKSLKQLEGTRGLTPSARQDGEEGEIEQASYEIRRFDGTEKIPDRLPLLEERPRRLFTDYQIDVQLGGQYNSNVGLTPLSRNLAPGSQSSIQALFSPFASVDLYEADAWRVGTAFAGDFTLNEGDFERFNLQSYRPGAFVEADLFWGETLIIPRVDYEFGIDEFDFSTFATRNQVNTSALAVWSPTQATIGFWSIDYTDFRNDGAVPFVTSRDGWTNALGVTHEVTLPYRHWSLVRGTVQVDHAEARGSDYRYNGVELSSGVEVPLWYGVEARGRAGWGFRDYPDFVSGPARNEHIITAGAELRRLIGRGVSAAAVASYDRFISDNTRFDTERVLFGLLLIYER
jgi:tetratricopeptide (TPR) repeat protein